MIAILDAAYSETGAAIACVLADSFGSPSASRILTKTARHSQADYKPGAFFERELPLLNSILADLETIPSILIIDGYVWLGRHQEKGLGAHLHDALSGSCAIIGAAKTRFRNDDWSTSIQRGQSQNPLYITAAGMNSDEAAESIRSMHGSHRIPTLLKSADRAARDALTAMQPTRPKIL